MIDCQQAFALLQDILDKEASQVDEKQVRAHLEKCIHCFEKFRLEESIQAFLNEKIKATASNDSKPEKLESMRLNLMSQLDDIDLECTKNSHSPFGSSFKIFLSTAALILLTGIWYVSSGFINHQQQYIPLEQAHFEAIENISLYANQADYLETIAQNLNYNVKTSFADYSYVGGQKENIMNTDFEHIVLTNNNDCISIFIANANTFEIPKDLESSFIKRADVILFDHNCRNCRLIYHKVGSLIIITASTNKDIDLAEFIPGNFSI